jgi:hypothetical protein
MVHISHYHGHGMMETHTVGRATIGSGKDTTKFLMVIDKPLGGFFRQVVHQRRKFWVEQLQSPGVCGPPGGDATKECVDCNGHVFIRFTIQRVLAVDAFQKQRSKLLVHNVSSASRSVHQSFVPIELGEEFTAERTIRRQIKEVRQMGQYLIFRISKQSPVYQGFSSSDLFLHGWTL